MPAHSIWLEPPPPGAFAQTVKFAPSAPGRWQRQALSRSPWVHSHLNRVPNLDHVVLVTCRDLTGVGMGWARNNPIMVFQTTITVVHNIYGGITDLNMCFQPFYDSLRISTVLLCTKNNINVQKNPAAAPQSQKHSNSKAIKIKLNNFFYYTMVS